MEKYNYEVICLFIEKLNFKIGEVDLSTESIHGKLVRAVKVTNKKEEILFYKIFTRDLDPNSAFVGFVVKDLVFENKNIEIKSQQVTIDNLHLFQLESNDYRRFDTWIKTKNHDFYRVLFQETADAIVNSIMPYFVYYDNSEEEIDFDLLTEEEQEKIIEEDKDFFMTEIFKKLKEIKTTDYNKLEDLYKIISYL
jgi:hypothetical protein